MKISIEEINKELAEEILIMCHEVDDEIHEIVNKLKTENELILKFFDYELKGVGDFTAKETY